MKRKVGETVICPDAREGCEGTFIRESWSQVRCKNCKRIWKREDNRRRAALRRAEKREEKRLMDGKKKKYPRHPCWSCGKPTTNRALCTNCYENGEDRAEYDAITAPTNCALDKARQDAEEAMIARTIVYNSNELSQEDLCKLIPSHPSYDPTFAPGAATQR